MHAAGADHSHVRPVVLVVDDEPAILTLARVILERAGYNVRAAADGPAALAHVRAAGDRLAAVVLDVRLPGDSGWDVLAGLRRLRPALRVVMTSGDGHTSVPDYGAGAGPIALLPKPFRPAELVEVVARVLATP